jgi:hypothetical protein
MKFKKVKLAENIDLNVSGEKMKFSIYRNENGNLDIIAENWDCKKYPNGMFYNMLSDELTLSTNAQ